MNGILKKATLFLLVLVLVATIGFGCGNGGNGGKVTIVIGEVTDLTGVASPSTAVLHYGMLDLCTYYNEEDLIPGVKLKLAAWDSHLDASRDIPGYEWCREKGAEVIIAVIPWQTITLKPFGERDKVPICSLSNNKSMRIPPGWAFCFSPSFTEQTRALLEWVSENHWDYANGIPEVGFVGWRQESQFEVDAAIKEWVQDNPGKFDYAGALLSPVGTMTFTSDAQRFKDCDYIYPFGSPLPYSMRDFRARGFEGTFFSDSTAGSYRGICEDLIGWEGLDGTLSLEVEPWWDESVPMVDLAKEILHRYRSDQAEDLVYAGSSYKGMISIGMFILEIVRKAIEEVGAENFDGQAFYNAAIKTKIQFEGYPERGFTETSREYLHHARMYEWRAEAEDLVKISDWLPLIEE